MLALQRTPELLLWCRTPRAWHILPLFCMERETTEEHCCISQDLLLAEAGFILILLRIEAEALLLTESWVRYVSQ